MAGYPLIHQLVNLVEECEKANTQNVNLTLEYFTAFLNQRVNSGKSMENNPDIRFGNEEDRAQEIAYQLDNNIGRLFVYMSRYAKSYIKKALDGTALHTGEDFTFLAILLTHTDLSKTELISRNLLEKTSGTEVIKRLINNGLVKQSNNQDDKRSKRIAITDKGKELLYLVFRDMNHVGRIVTGTLSYEEKLTLQYLLQKLEDFHYQLHKDKTILTKQDMVSYTNKS